MISFLLSPKAIFEASVPIMIPEIHLLSEKEHGDTPLFEISLEKALLFRNEVHLLAISRAFEISEKNNIDLGICDICCKLNIEFVQKELHGLFGKQFNIMI